MLMDKELVENTEKEDASTYMTGDLEDLKDIDNIVLEEEDLFGEEDVLSKRPLPYTTEMVVEEQDMSNGSVLPEMYNSLKNMLGNGKVCTKEEEIDLINRIHAGDRDALNEFVERNQKLVIYVAKRYIGVSNHDLMDLIQEGNLGLLKAIDRFEVERGNRFSTYAVNWIRQAISRSVETTGNTMQIPVYAYSAFVKAQAKATKAASITGDVVTWDMIRKHLLEEEGVTQFLIDALKNFYDSKSSLSLDYCLSSSSGGNESDDFRLIDVLETKDKDTIPEAYLERICLSDMLEEAMKTLTDKEKKIIHLRFGLGGGSPMTLEEIGVMQGLTRERIRQIEAKAIGKLRKRKSRFLRECLV